jgi:hypothetical protein
VKTVFVFLLVLLFPFTVEISLIRTIPVKADKIYADSFENIYIISGSTLVKYNYRGDKKSVYDSPNRENISMVDIKNPMKILLFFRDQNKIVFADNELSKIGDEIYLENYGVFGDIKLCTAESGGVWVFDDSNDALIKFNTDFKEVFRKNLFEIEIEPEFMTTGKNSLFIRTRNNTVSVFDNLGNFNFKIEKKIPSDFFVKNSNIEYFDKKKNVFSIYNFETGNFTEKLLPDTLNVLNAIQTPSFLIFNDEKNVFISRLNHEKTDKP